MKLCKCSLENHLLYMQNLSKKKCILHKTFCFVFVFVYFLVKLFFFFFFNNLQIHKPCLQQARALGYPLGPAQV